LENRRDGTPFSGRPRRDAEQLPAQDAAMRPTDLPLHMPRPLALTFTLFSLPTSAFPAGARHRLPPLGLIVSSPHCLPWLREARQLLAAIYGPQSSLITVTIHNTHGQGVEFLLPPDENGRHKQRSRPVERKLEIVERQLRPVELAALEAAEDKP